MSGRLERVGEYLVKGVIGEGGMGVVYEGVQPVIGKRVAIKLLKQDFAEEPEEARRLLDEARSVNQIGHRGIIDIFSFGTLPDGRQYFVMEYLGGIPLSKHVADHAPLLPQDALQIVDEIAAALAAAHNAGVIHRDLKPSNVFLVVSPDGSSYVKLLDFGLAKQAPFARGHAPQTRQSRVLGTPEFIAPEQARAEPVGPCTDLYALGVVAYEMLTGRLPFQGKTVQETVRMHLDTPPLPPSQIEESIPPEIEALVLRLLEKEAEHRPPSAEVVRQEIKRLRKTLNLAATRLAVEVKAPAAARPKLPPAPAAAQDQEFTWTPAHRRPAVSGDRETGAEPRTEKVSADEIDAAQTRELPVEDERGPPRPPPEAAAKPGAFRKRLDGAPAEQAPRTPPLLIGIGVTLVVVLIALAVVMIIGLQRGS